VLEYLSIDIRVGYQSKGLPTKGLTGKAQ